MSKYKEVFRNSPNSSRTMKPEGIVLHHTAGGYSGSVSWCLNAQAKVSYHCIVNTTGERTVLVPDNVRAWHAGVSSFKGKANCNNFLLGIAVSGNTNERELTNEETESVAEWCVRKMKSYNFGLDMITTHREIAPNRKNDVDSRAEKRIKDKIIELIK
jgi:AmpD protein